MHNTKVLIETKLPFTFTYFKSLPVSFSASLRSTLSCRNDSGIPCTKSKSTVSDGTCILPESGSVLTKNCSSGGTWEEIQLHLDCCPLAFEAHILFSNNKTAEWLREIACIIQNGFQELIPWT